MTLLAVLDFIWRGEGTNKEILLFEKKGGVKYE
jgi:hypothetical protein